MALKSRPQIAFYILDLSMHVGWAPGKCTWSQAVSSPHPDPCMELGSPWRQRAVCPHRAPFLGSADPPLIGPESCLWDAHFCLIEQGCLERVVYHAKLTSAGATVQTQTSPLGLFSPVQLHPRGAPEPQALGPRRCTSSPHSGMLSWCTCSSFGPKGRRAR